MTRRYPVTRLTDAETVGEHFLYRIFDAGDVLLYIGCTVNPYGRIEYHRQPFARSGGLSYAWELYQRFDHYTVSAPYPTKVDARAAERAAIADESPVFNKQHQRTQVRGRRMPAKRLGRRILVTDKALREWLEGLADA